MRLLLEIKLSKNEFPKDYHSSIISYIKNALSVCDNGRQYDKFYKDTQKKKFCFTVMLGKCKFTKTNIMLEGNMIKILISISEEGNEKYILFNSLIAQKNKLYPLPNGNNMMLLKITQLKNVEIKNSKAVFKTYSGSGLCIREHNSDTNRDKYYVYNDEGFKEQFLYVVREQALRAGFSREIAENVKFTPINLKKVVTLHYGIYIDVTVGMFELEADSRLLQFLYLTGLGSRTSAGYGMLDLISQEGGEEC